MTTSSGPGLGPAIPRRRLGAELKRLREERGKKLADVAGDLLFSTSKLSRLETGQAAPTERDMRDLMNYFALDGTDIGQRMRNWAREAREQPWWQEMPGVGPGLAKYLQYETAAAQLSGFVRNFVPILLQTPGYARALASALEGGSRAEIDQLVAVWLKRQEVIHREEYPLALDMVIDESVFHRFVGSPAVMREQLTALAAASARPAITLRVIRFAAGPHPAMSEGSFSIFHFRRAIDPDVANVESHFTDTYLDRQDQVDVYRSLLDGLRDMALDPPSSTEYIRQMAQAY